MALMSSQSGTSKAHTVEPTEKLLKLNVQKFIEGPDGNPVTNPTYALVEKVKAKAEEIFNVFGGKKDIKYEVAPYTTKDGRDGVDCSIRFACYGEEKTEKGQDGKMHKPSQTVKLSLKQEDMSINFVDVSKFDRQAKRPVAVKWAEQFKDTKDARKALEDAGLVKAFEPKQGEVEHTPEGDIRASLFDVVKEVNATAEKVTNKEGKEANKYFLGEIKDTSFTTKDGEKVEQKSFSINSHSSQRIDVNMQDGKVASLTALDFADYETTKDSSKIQRVNIYQPDYLKKLDQLDAGIVKIASALDWKGREKADVAKDGPIEGVSAGMPIEEDVEPDWDNADDFADR